MIGSFFQAVDGSIYIVYSHKEGKVKAYRYYNNDYAGTIELNVGQLHNMTPMTGSV